MMSPVGYQSHRRRDDNRLLDPSCSLNYRGLVGVSFRVAKPSVSAKGNICSS